MSGPVLESLNEKECLALLKRVKYGRVAVVTREGRPEIFRLILRCTGGRSFL